MIRLIELLDDKRYREYFLKVPALPQVKRIAPPWRLYVQRETDGPWARKEFNTYREAFQNLKSRYLKESHDACIQSKGTAFDPPYRIVKVTRGGIVQMTKGPNPQPITRVVIWKPQLPPDETAHRWCPYCRRPTIFGWFSHHHAFPRGTTLAYDPSLKRCTICGASENLVMA